MRSPTIHTIQCCGSPERPRAPLACNTQIHRGDELPLPAKPRPELTPVPPAVAGALLRGEQVSFLEFLCEPATENYCAMLLGSDGTAAAKMLRELRNATESHYFGYWRAKPRSKQSAEGSGKLIAPAAATKKLLKKYARRAYRGDTERRGVIYWERVAWLIWNCYASLMALRLRAETIQAQEVKRLESLPGERAARTKYMRAYRAKQREQQRAKAGYFTTKEAKEKWRRQRTQTRKGVTQ
jgi:hypothetical protein